MPVKRDKHDDIFSQCVRQAAAWTCQRCGVVDADGQATSRSLRMHCSHIYGRRNLATRWHPDNAICLCAACHKDLGDDPIQHAAFARAYLGDTRYDALVLLANSVWKWRRADKVEMYQHYKGELRRLQQLGCADEVVSYQ